VVPSFISESGPNRKYGTKGTILGLTLKTTRGHVYRAALEGLSFQLKQALEILSRATGVKPTELRVVGGGSKNQLWNKIRADVTGLPVMVPRQKEATVLGASLTAFTGAGYYKTLEEAVKTVREEVEVYKPGLDKEVYEKAYARYLRVPPSLREFYLTA